MIFLSASVPSPTRNKLYYESADIIAIRDAVRALATVVIPQSTLVWGGHPAITPLIRYVLATMEVDVGSHVTLYQSEFFKKQFPEDNEAIENIVVTPDLGDRNSSLNAMRERMIGGNSFDGAFFIGGMEGVLEEYVMFTKIHPECPRFPVASTGAAAKIIYDQLDQKDARLESDYAYMELFSNLLKN